ncbi:hypothetical protein LG634_29670 [Streptomyces bambusae]|uniref:hypothetical protein n=1 Tax=Streptomyces bambusae TaxID=1550616 RepID=UPI001CFC7369|nr:hypothetical protein [Streptomyces bambusae]MCB5168972.1 hypothetical protein [Streptomyces bambusae]
MAPNTQRGEAPVVTAAAAPLPGPADPAPPGPEARGCLYALSQPPLMIFLSVIAALLLMAAVHDLLLL